MGFFKNIKDWGIERRDAFLGIDKKFEELYQKELLPEEVINTLNTIDEEVENADNRYTEARTNLKKATENVSVKFQTLQQRENEFKAFKEEHHGILAKIWYNMPPIRWITPTGRMYQRLRREIKILRREHKFWEERANEENINVDQNEVARNDKRRTRAEYKRIIVDRAKLFKNEIKLYDVYSKLDSLDKLNALNRLIGEENANRLKNALTGFYENWCKTDYKADFDFDVVAVTKVLSKFRKGKELTKNDIETFNGTKVKKDPTNDTKKQSRQRKDFPPKAVDLHTHGLNREILENMAKVFGEETQVEDLLDAFYCLNEVQKQHGTISDDNYVAMLEQFVSNATEARQEGDEESIQRAQKGAKQFGEMIKDPGKAGILATYVEQYRGIRLEKAQQRMVAKIEKLNEMHGRT